MPDKHERLAEVVVVVVIMGMAIVVDDGRSAYEPLMWSDACLWSSACLLLPEGSECCCWSVV